MKGPRIRIGTSVLSVVIVGLSMVLAAQRRDAARQGATARGKIARLEALLRREMARGADLATAHTIQLEKMDRSVRELVARHEEELRRLKGLQVEIERTAARYSQSAERSARDEKSALKSAAHWGEQAAMVQRIADSLPEEQRGQYRNGVRVYERTAAICRSRADHYGRLKRKYECASKHPELPVEPDPPLPK